MKRDLRDYARQTSFRLIVGGILILFLVGDGLIYLIYGSAAALSGLLCLGFGMAPILAILLVLALMEWIVKRVDRD
jgi:hypothetical protein